MRSSRRINAPVIACLALAAVLLVVYAGGYFFLSRGVECAYPGGFGLRTYPTQWLAAIYRPAAMIEGLIRGYTIGTDYHDPTNS